MLVRTNAWHTVHDQSGSKIAALEVAPREQNILCVNIGRLRIVPATRHAPAGNLRCAGSVAVVQLARAYKADGMYAYSKHQSFVGAGYFDAVQNTIMDGLSSTTALAGSTEEEQFVA